jgi:hypothetical protein
MSLEEIEQGAVRLPSDKVAAAMHATIVQTVNDVRDAARDAVRRWREQHGETRYSDAPREVTDAWRRDAESRSRRLLTWLVLDAITHAIDGPADEQDTKLDRLFPPPNPQATTFKIILADVRLRDRRLDCVGRRQPRLRRPRRRSPLRRRDPPARNDRVDRPQRRLGPAHRRVPGRRRLEHQRRLGRPRRPTHRRLNPARHE